MMNEIWKPIQDFDNYEISNLGRIRNIKRNKCLALSLNNGYCQTNLYKDGKKYPRKVHRLVAQAFIPNPDNLPEVNHINENRADNRVENLEWCDRTYNNNYGNRIEKFIKSVSKPVLQFTLDGIFVEEFLNAKEASIKTNIVKSNICRCCNGKRLSAGNFKWEYKQ